MYGLTINFTGIIPPPTPTITVSPFFPFLFSPISLLWDAYCSFFALLPPGYRAKLDAYTSLIGVGGRSFTFVLFVVLVGLLVVGLLEAATGIFGAVAVSDTDAEEVSNSREAEAEEGTLKKNGSIVPAVPRKWLGQWWNIHRRKTSSARSVNQDTGEGEVEGSAGKAKTRGINGSSESEADVDVVTSEEHEPKEEAGEGGDGRGKDIGTTKVAHAALPLLPSPQSLAPLSPPVTHGSTAATIQLALTPTHTPTSVHLSPAPQTPAPTTTDLVTRAHILASAIIAKHSNNTSSPLNDPNWYNDYDNNPSPSTLGRPDSSTIKLPKLEAQVVPSSATTPAFAATIRATIRNSTSGTQAGPISYPYPPSSSTSLPRLFTTPTTAPLLPAPHFTSVLPSPTTPAFNSSRKLLAATTTAQSTPRTPIITSKKPIINKSKKEKKEKKEAIAAKKKSNSKKVRGKGTDPHKTRREATMDITTATEGEQEALQALRRRSSAAATDTAASDTAAAEFSFRSSSSRCSTSSSAGESFSSSSYNSPSSCVGSSFSSSLGGSTLTGTSTSSPSIISTPGSRKGGAVTTIRGIDATILLTPTTACGDTPMRPTLPTTSSRAAAQPLPSTPLRRSTTLPITPSSVPTTGARTTKTPRKKREALDLPTMFHTLLSSVPGLSFPEGPVLSRNSYTRDLHSALVSACHGRAVKRLSRRSGTTTPQVSQSARRSTVAGTSATTTPSSSMLLSSPMPATPKLNMEDSACFMSESQVSLSPMMASGSGHLSSMPSLSPSPFFFPATNTTAPSSAAHQSQRQSQSESSLLETHASDVDALLSQLVRGAFKRRFVWPDIDNEGLWREVRNGVDWLIGMEVGAVRELGVEVIMARARWVKENGVYEENEREKRRRRRKERKEQKEEQLKKEEEEKAAEEKEGKKKQEDEVIKKEEKIEMVEKTEMVEEEENDLVVITKESLVLDDEEETGTETQATTTEAESTSPTTPKQREEAARRRQERRERREIAYADREAATATAHAQQQQKQLLLQQGRTATIISSFITWWRKIGLSTSVSRTWRDYSVYDHEVHVPCLVEEEDAGYGGDDEVVLVDGSGGMRSSVMMGKAGEMGRKKTKAAAGKGGLEDSPGGISLRGMMSSSMTLTRTGGTPGRAGVTSIAGFSRGHTPSLSTSTTTGD